METNQVVCGFSFVVEVPTNVSEASSQLDSIAMRVMKAIALEFTATEVLQDPGVAFAWTNDREAYPNIYECRKCNRLGTARNMDQEIFTMMLGTLNEDGFLCDECSVDWGI